MADEKQPKYWKLHNYLEKWRNFDQLPEEEKQKLRSTSLQDAMLEDALADEADEAEQRDLDRRKVEAVELWLQLQREASSTKPEAEYSHDELEQYIAHRTEGLAVKSIYWLNQAAEALWMCTKGKISPASMAALRTFVLERYSSHESHKKVLSFTTAFLKYLSKTKFDQSYLSFAAFLEPPKTVKVRKVVTERIVTRADIALLFTRIEDCAKGHINAEKARNYRALALLASFTGLRPSTLERLTVGQFRAALKQEKPVLHVLAWQEKNRVEHYVPIHPSVARALSEVLEHDFSKDDDAKPLFMYNSFLKWLERQRIPLLHVRDPKKAHLWLSDFRKFCQQFGDTIGWDATNSKYVLAHGMIGVEWSHYRHFFPENIYDVYMKAWRDINLTA